MKKLIVSGVLLMGVNVCLLAQTGTADSSRNIPPRRPLHVSGNYEPVPLKSVPPQTVQNKKKKKKEKKISNATTETVAVDTFLQNKSLQLFGDSTSTDEPAP